MLDPADLGREGGDVVQGTAGGSTGAVAACLPFWDRICSADSYVPGWLRFGFPLKWLRGPATPSDSSNSASAKQASAFVSDSIRELVQAGAARVWGRRPTVVSPLSVVPKKNGKLRLILDMRHVNAFLNVPSFKFERLLDVEFISDLYDLMIGIDLTNGYWQVPMHPDAFEYLGFEWEGQFYVFCVLPFGLSSAPWCFAKVMKAFSTHLRARFGIRLLNYLDDFLFFLGCDAETARVVKARIPEEFRQSGLTINLSKSHLDPSTLQRSLGFWVNTDLGTFSVPEDRWVAMQTVIRRLLGAGKGSARLVATAAGHASSMGLAVGQATRLFTRDMHALIAEHPGWDTVRPLSPGAVVELKFWSRMTRTDMCSPIWRDARVAQVTINTDASGFGRGAVMGDREAQGYLSAPERLLSSGEREVIAVLRGLKSFDALLEGKRVLVLSDSTNAVAIIDHGSSKPSLNALAVEIYHFCLMHCIILTVKWVPREQNSAADSVSKWQDSSDWKLNPSWFRELDAQFGPHTVDRFASSVNTMLPRFNSYFYCPGTEAVDCFAQAWAGENNWCNPPFCLIGRLLRLLQQQKAQATLIVPVWVSAAWWPLLCPQGAEFAPWVVGVVRLPRSANLFLPGLASGNAFGVGVPRWDVLAVRVDCRSVQSHFRASRKFM